MKATISPKNFKNILNTAMVDGIIDPINITTSKDGLSATNTTEQKHIISIVHAPPTFFTELEATDPENFTFGSEVKDRLGWGFKKETLALVADENKLLISDTTDKLPVELDEKVDRTVPLPLTPTKFGLFPDFNLYKELQEVKNKPSDWSDELTFEFFNIYKTNVSNLKFPGSVINYPFSCKDNKLSVTIGGTSTSFTHNIEGEHIQGKDIKILISADIFKRAISCFNDTVYLVFNENVLVIMEENQEISKTISIGTKEE